MIMKKLVSYEEVGYEREDFITMKEVAKMLSISIQAVAGMLDRGAINEYVDDSVTNPRKGRRLILVGDIEELT